jgi:hypothetical protein
MKSLFKRQRSRSQVIVLRGDGWIHPDSDIANEVRRLRWVYRLSARNVQPTLQFNIPIYKPE